MYYWRKLKVKTVSGASCCPFQASPGSVIFQIFVSPSSFLLPQLVNLTHLYECVYIYTHTIGQTTLGQYPTKIDRHFQFLHILLACFCRSKPFTLI